MPVDRYQNSTGYEHPQESNLLNIHKVMQYNNTGQPVARVHVDGITLEGDVIVDTVSLSSSTLAALESINVQNNVSATITGSVIVSNFTSTVQIANTVTVNQGSSPWVITGTVSLGSSSEVEIKNDTGNPIPVSKNTSVNSDTNPIFVKGTSDTSFFAPTQSDAFGRLRISEPFTLADMFNRYQDNGQASNYTTGTAAVGYNANMASVLLSIGTGSGDAIYRETDRVYAYQPGKSLLVLQTFTFEAKKPNLTQRAGYFDVQNGIYLEQAGTSVYFVKRSSVTSVLTETRVEQANWNVNTLSGLDLSKSQIFWMDIEWLGVGSVRCGFVIDGAFVHCHTFHHANNITGVYMTTSCLPLRKEIFNTAATTSTSTLYSICASVISEGGYSITGRSRCVGHNLGSPVSLPNDVTFKPIISIRLKSSRPGAIVLPTTFTITPVQQAIYKYEIRTKAVTTGGTWISASSDSSVEYNLNPTALITGTVALTAFVNASNQATGVSEASTLPFSYQLERNSFTSQMYEIVILVASSGNSTSAYGSINWEEIT